MMKGITAIIICSTLLLSIATISIAVDTIRLHQTIRDGNTIVSAGGEFELGFFSPDMSTNRYVGIWYKRISHGTVVWVANRQTPLTDTSGVLTVDSTAILLLVNGSNTIIWSSNLSPRLLKNPVVQLLDNGNLVLKDKNGSDPQNDSFVWQSFDYPGDTILPGMKFGVDSVTGLERYYTSWKSSNDPSLGYYSNRLDHHGYPQFILWKGSLLQSRTGPWTGKEFSGNPIAKPNGIYTNKFVMNPNEIYYAFDLVNKSSVSAITRLLLTPNGDTRRLIWIDQVQEWTTYITLQVSDCDHYGLCGSYSTCNINKSPRCECLRGFVPKFPEKWEAADRSAGCIRKTPLVCGNRDGFTKYSGIKLPDTRLSRYHMSKSLEECQNLCSNNCSCSAYANTGTPGVRSVCLLWFDELMDVTEITGEAQDFYVRMVASELEASGKSRVKKRTQIIVVPVVLTVSLAFILFYVLKRRKMKIEGRLRSSSERVDENEREDIDLPLFDFTVIANATNNFSQNNKLGEGGYGLVYKGMLENGQAIAVKRLSQHSHQGIDEFKNEVSCICKLQHRNLVSLPGCCIDKREKILIYEYMPNKSLDSFVFDQAISKSLDWPKRCNIINGIARGLLYLHQDSKLRIIHRDIKASNILLDHDMNPKISDFGLARSFSGTQTEANTTRVVGTYGYMSPEYAIDGQFSIKSDVYSFGVLLIEIVSGKRNRCFDHTDHSHNLLGHAWKSFVEGKILDVIDGGILESSKRNEVSRAIQIGLLCVQQYPQDRPSMSAVVFMLNGKTALAQPKEPGFFTERKQHQAEYSSTKPVLFSFDEFTVSDVSPRL